MDLTKPVTYRSVALNDVVVASTHPLIGCQIDSADYAGVGGVGYTEKRSMDDGNDSSDVFLSNRRVLLQGSIYDEDLATLFDRLQTMRYAFNPKTAYDDNDDELGYHPLYFEVPTRKEAWPLDPDGVSRHIPQMLKVRPIQVLQWVIRRDVLGAKDQNGQGIQWQAALEARDPRVYAQTWVEHTAWGTGSSGGGTMVHKGDYWSPLNILIAAPKPTVKTTFDITIGSSRMQLIIPANTLQDQVIRYHGDEKVVTLEVEGKRTLRMDLLTFTSGETHPVMKPGDNDFTWQRTPASAMPVNSRMWFWESWA